MIGFFFGTSMAAVAGPCDQDFTVGCFTKASEKSIQNFVAKIDAFCSPIAVKNTFSQVGSNEHRVALAECRSQILSAYEASDKTDFSVIYQSLSSNPHKLDHKDKSGQAAGEN